MRSSSQQARHTPSAKAVSKRCVKDAEQELHCSPYLETKTDPESRAIVRCVLRLEDISRDDAADRASHNHEGGREALLVLADHVVVLVGPLGGDVAGDAHDAEEDSAVARMDSRGKSSQGDAYDVEERVED